MSGSVYTSPKVKELVIVVYKPPKHFLSKEQLRKIDVSGISREYQNTKELDYYM